MGMIDTLISKACGKAKNTIPFRLDVLGGYSTGFRGLNCSILNIFNNADILNVRKLIYYDCLYRHDKPAPGQNTFNAMQRLLSLNPSTKFFIYELTGNATDDPNAVFGGTPTKTNGQFWTNFPSSPEADPTKAGNVVTTVSRLKKIFPAFSTLALARLIDNAIKTGYITEAFVRTKFKAGGDALMDAIKSDLKPRGTYASTTPAPAGKTFAGQWTAAKNISAISAVADSVRKEVVSNPLIKLFGWGPPDLGDMSHDSHMQEFAWEHMAG